MKNNRITKILVLLASLASVTVFAQTTSATRESATQGAVKGMGPESAKQQAKVGAKGSTSTSDAGVQQVVKKADKFSGNVGASFSYFYRDNALSTNSTLAKYLKSGIMNISGFGSASYGNYEVLDGVFTPYAGVGASKLSHTESKLEDFDYMSQKFYVMGDWKYADGWAINPSLEYTRIESVEFNTEDYKEWYPNVSVGKSWNIDEVSIFRAYVNTGYHFSNVEAYAGTQATSDRLDNWTNTLSLNYYRSLWMGIMGHAYSDFGWKSYSNGQNSKRDDFDKTVGGSLAYTWWDFLRLSVFATYIDRSSSDKTSAAAKVNEYDNVDTGVNLSAFYKF